MDDKHHISAGKLPEGTKGFTLIEALVAITILLLGVLGPLSAATRGITDGLIAKNKIVALGLAQEGIELVRAKIDSNFGTPAPWLTDLDSCLYPNTCLVKVVANEYEPCNPSIFFPAVGTCDLRSDNNGIYVSIGGTTGQIFSRTIQIAITSASPPLVADAEAKVTVTIGWYDKNQYRDLTLTAYVYNHP